MTEAKPGLGILLTLAVSLCLVSSAGLAQPRGPWSGGDFRPGERRGPGGRMGGPMGQFEEVAPKVGDLMPDVAVFDAEGVEHRLPDLLGERYTVLILGCLT